MSDDQISKTRGRGFSARMWARASGNLTAISAVTTVLVAFTTLFVAGIGLKAYLGETDARQRARIIDAWTLLHQTRGKGGNLGQLYALEQLNDAGANLRNVNLHWADLRRLELPGADLSGAGARSADFREANLSGAHLDDADFTCADLAGADLTGATLNHTNLTATDLRETNISQEQANGACANRYQPELNVKPEWKMGACANKGFGPEETPKMPPEVNPPPPCS